MYIVYICVCFCMCACMLSCVSSCRVRCSQQDDLSDVYSNVTVRQIPSGQALVVDRCYFLQRCDCVRAVFTCVFVPCSHHRTNPCLHAAAMWTSTRGTRKARR